MVIEDLRYLHEDLERLEQAIADRYVEEPKRDRDRLNRDHDIANLLANLHNQATKLLELYNSKQTERTEEAMALSRDPFDKFKQQVSEIKEYHTRHPNQPAENLETAYRLPGPGEERERASYVTTMFTGEEYFGRYFDMYDLHEQFLNLPSMKTERRVSYLRYLESFDTFSMIQKKDKVQNEYFAYVHALCTYLGDYLQKIKPLENLDKLIASWDGEFEKAWAEGTLPGWEQRPKSELIDSPSYCASCEKEFGNVNVHKHHLTSKKHLRNVAQKKDGADNGTSNGDTNAATGDVGVKKLREKAVAEREFRIKKLAAAMQTIRSDTRDNVERKAAMTEREREQELEALFEDRDEVMLEDDGKEDDEDQKIYNPLKLPLDWTGKPIPFWLYKLHGLGVEFECEICGNFTYMGRRAFDKHFTESRHTHGLKCLGIHSSPLFRDITKIDEAQKLWAKIVESKKREEKMMKDTVEMEDHEGNVMPEIIYKDLKNQGLI